MHQEPSSVRDPIRHENEYIIDAQPSRLCMLAVPNVTVISHALSRPLAVLDGERKLQTGLLRSSEEGKPPMAQCEPDDVMMVIQDCCIEYNMCSYINEAEIWIDQPNISRYFSSRQTRHGRELMNKEKAKEGRGSLGEASPISRVRRQMVPIARHVSSRRKTGMLPSPGLSCHLQIREFRDVRRHEVAKVAWA